MPEVKPASGPEPKPEFRQQPAPVETKPSEGKDDAAIEKARRLSRTIIDDIYLYNSAKVMDAIRNGNFYAVFAPELKEGQKLYENRIPQEIRNSAKLLQGNHRGIYRQEEKRIKLDFIQKTEIFEENTRKHRLTSLFRLQKDLALRHAFLVY